MTDTGPWRNVAPTLTLAGLALAVALSAQDHPVAPHEHPEAQTLVNPMVATPGSLSSGADSYAKACAVCHGATGAGDGKLARATAAYGVRPSDLTDDIWQHGSSDGEIFVAIRDGISPDFSMNAWKGRLSDEEMWNVVNYVKSLGGGK